MIAPALTIARRELRGGLKGFRVLIACLALGVAAIAGVRSLSAAVDAGLAREGRALHGGDIVVRSLYRPVDAATEARLEAAGTVSRSIEMRSMARFGDRRRLVELKAVDGRYPLYGHVVLDPAGGLAAALAKREGVWGAVAEQGLLDQLGARVGDRIGLGEATFAIRAVLRAEPDRGISFVGFGPRLMIDQAAIAETGLIQPGSLARHVDRLAMRPGASPGDDPEALLAGLERADPGHAWRGTTYHEAAPALRRALDRLTLFLTLVGLASLLVGGVGVANAVRTFLQARAPTIATLKCLGASSGLVFAAYLAEIAALAGVGIAIGLVAGAAAPWLLAGPLAGVLPVPLVPALDPAGLALAAAFGALVTLAFGIWPLARARRIPAARLFRDIVAPDRRWPGAAFVAATALLGLALCALVVLTAGDRHLALWFVLGALGLLAVFLALAAVVVRLARALGRTIGPTRPAALRLALGNLARPGAPTASVVLSVGFGVTVLAAIATVQVSLAREIEDRLPESAPTYFFVDIQPDQVAGFDAAIAAVPGARLIDQLPQLRARIVRIAGRPVGEVEIAPNVRWAVQNERGLTYMAHMPAGTELAAGHWWPPDYRGPPLISFDAALAKGFGIGIGDTLTFAVLGREITARIASLRHIEWGGLQMQFTTIFAPGTLEGAPHTWIATVAADPAAEAPLVRAVTDRFANVSAIRVKDALDAAARVLGEIGWAVRGVAAVALVAGVLVLGGAVAAGQRRRVYEAVVLKVLGATRLDLVAAFAIEFVLLGAATAAVGTVAGGIAGWAVATELLGIAFVPGWGTLAGVALACVAVTTGFGTLAVFRALGRKAAPVLRHA